MCLRSFETCSAVVPAVRVSMAHPSPITLLSHFPIALTSPLPLLLLSPSCMARDRARRSPQQVQRPRCPSCGKHFTDVLRHLNHKQSKCANWFDTAPPQRRSSPRPIGDPPSDPIDPPSNIPDAKRSPSPPLPHQQPQSVPFPRAAETYGQTKSFMDKFDDDQFSELRKTNLYYLFMGKDEWELASFLLSSGLSMGKIDKFLRLKMVSVPTLCLVTGD
jgi:transposase-like protein